MTAILNGIGPLDAELWVIGEAPDQQSLAEGRPFVGATGRFLRDYLRKNSVIESEIRIEYLINIGAPKNDFEFFESKENLDALHQSISRLKDRIKTGKPNVLLLLGAKTLKHITGMVNISSWRGHIIWSDELNCKIVSTYNPSHALRQKYAGASAPPGQYEALFGVDVQRAVKESHSIALPFPQYTTIVEPSYSQAMDYLTEIKKNAIILSYDIETINNSLMDCIGFCPKEDLTICVPFYYTPAERYWKSDSEFLSIFRLVKEILESDIPKVAQNSQYDNVIMKEYYKIDVRNLVWDTMVSAHDLYSELPKDLGSLISFFTELPYQKHLGKTGKIHDRWVYNAADAVANLHIMRGQIKEAADLGTLDHYRRIPRAVIRPLTEMQLAGNAIDLPKRDHAIRHERQFQKETLEVLNMVMPSVFPSNVKKKLGIKFNPNSGDDKKILFINMFGCKPQYKNKALTLDKNAMTKYMEDKRPHVALLAKIIRKYRLSVTMLGKLASPLKNGRMHTAFNVGGLDKDGDEIGTDTGRLTSRKSIFGTGTNLQNLQKGLQRQMIIPG